MAKRSGPSDASNETAAFPNLGGRAPLPHQIDWHSRAKQIWKRFPKAHKHIGTLINEAAAASTDVIGSDPVARKKFNGKRTASDAFAKAMFDATDFADLGLTFEEWMGDETAWTTAVEDLPEFDPRALLDSLAAGGGLELGISSTRDLVPVRVRRGAAGPSPDQIAILNEFFIMHVRDLGSEPVSPAHLLLFEWSDETKDWQVLNALPDSRIDPRKAYGVTARVDGNATPLHLGVRVGPPRLEFDLYLLGQRGEFDHRALAKIDALGPAAILSQREMARVLALLTQADRGLRVAKRRYAVQ